MKKFTVYLCSLIICVGFVASAPAYAVPFGFYNITNNNAADAVIGEAQLSVDVTDPGGAQVLFTFMNVGPNACSIADVYFDDGVLFGIAFIDNLDPGVSFSQLATPGNLPGANNASPPFVTSPGFSADSDPPAEPNGVNPGESLGIVFDLQGGFTFANVITDLSSGDLRIGIHVQGFDGGGSESFVNNPDPIPEPATMLLLGTGLIGLAGLGRRKFFKKTQS